MVSNTTGHDNTAFGDAALAGNTTGFFNTATGDTALASNTTGSNNTANGILALFSNTTASENTGVGSQALYFNTTGEGNTGIGNLALASNDTATDNTAVGNNALLSTVTGDHNTAIGSFALRLNTGQRNTATGANALVANTTGSFNTANGLGAMADNTTGSFNTAMGRLALGGNTTGGSNTALGVGSLANCNGNGNTALGTSAGANLTIGDNNIDIGNQGVAGESNTIRIGTQGTQTKAFIAGISGTVVSGTPVKINRSGQLGVEPSSERFKQNIKAMDDASDTVLALKPVTFRYKPEIDPDGIPQFGLVAEEVEKVNPDLVVRDPDGKVYTVRYEAVNAMLLNEFLKEHRKNEEQGAAIAQQQTEISALKAELKEQASQIQKVNDKIELSRSAPQTVLNNH
jgi:Chaperone of endosialidase